MLNSNLTFSPQIFEINNLNSALLPIKIFFQHIFSLTNKNLNLQCLLKTWTYLSIWSHTNKWKSQNLQNQRTLWHCAWHWQFIQQNLQITWHSIKSWLLSLFSKSYRKTQFVIDICKIFSSTKMFLWNSVEFRNLKLLSCISVEVSSKAEPKNENLPHAMHCFFRIKQYNK